MPRIFISYRRTDTMKDAGRIYDRLLEAFGNENVFKDVDAIPIGSDFRWVLQDAIQNCDVVLVLIGEQWLEVDAATGLRRIDAENDFVRFEIEYALEQPHVTVIPVVIAPTQPPTAHILPEPLKKMAFLNMATVREDPDFHTDMSRLIKQLRELPSYFDTKPSCIRQIFKVIVSIVLLAICGVIASVSLLNPQLWAALMDKQSSPTPVPTIIPTEVIPTPSAIDLAVAGVIQNSDWAIYSPYVREFNEVPLVLVPSGCFTMGSTNTQIDYAMSFGLEREMFVDEQGIFAEVFLICMDEPYWIDQYEVSNAQYERIRGRPARGVWNEPDYPREAINWFNAAALCAMRGARLPTEAEWEYAARGPDNLIYPWGNEYDSNRLNDVNSAYDAIVAPITSFETGQSWVGALNMAGNVWEWTSTAYESGDESMVYHYPYTAIDGRENPADSTARRVIRGGSFTNNEDDSRTANRLAPKPDEAYSTIGLRCAADFDG
jgi:formylglycine-generating enzyme required for sulfatase activity